MKIKHRAVLIFGISILFTMTVTLFIVSYIFTQYIDKNELNDVTKSFDTINYIFNKEEDGLKTIAVDWAQWDDSYNFLAGSDNEFINKNLDEAIIKNLKLNLIIYTDLKGNVVFNKSFGLGNENSSSEGDQLINKDNDKFKKLITFNNNEEIHSGIIFLNKKLFFIAALPVTTTDMKAPSNGSLIIGRYVDDGFLNYMTNLLHSKIEFTELNYSNGTLETSNTDIEKESDKIRASKSLEDILGDKTISACITMEREDYINAIYPFKIFIVTFLLLILLVAFFDMAIINKFLVRRIDILYRFMEQVAVKKCMGKRIKLPGDDEISELAVCTNKMLTELQTAYDEISFLSYNDKLTGLKNRAYMESQLKDIDDKICDDYAVIMGDLNGLKLANDVFGHIEGDKLLITIGKILVESCGEDDIVARWGGDEFVILIKNKDNFYINTVMKKIKSSCNDSTELKFKFNIALGNAATKGRYIETEELMKIAEERMYSNKLRESRSYKNEAITYLKKSLYEKHNKMEEHAVRIKKLCKRFGHELGLSQRKLAELELSGELHDIGKIGVSDEILMKYDELTDNEWEHMKTHAEIGYRIAKSLPGIKNIAEDILYHHERFDGTGYPRGLKGEEIPFLSRILSIVNSFDVMAYGNSYENALGVEEAINELKRGAGSKFDPELVQKFLNMIVKDEAAVTRN